MRAESHDPAARIDNVELLRPRRSSDGASNRDVSSWTVALPFARALAAIALLVTRGVHLEQYTVAHFSAVATIGPLFLANFIAATILGLILLEPLCTTSWPKQLVFDALAAVAGIAVAAGALAALLTSEQTPLFGFMEQGYRLEIVIAIAAEGVAIISLGVVLVCARTRIRGTSGTRDGEPARSSRITVTYFVALDSLRHQVAMVSALATLIALSLLMILTCH